MPAAVAAIGRQPVASRQHHVDWLRVAAMFGVFLFHCSQFFNDWGWHVKNVPTTPAVSVFSLLLVQWIMPIFFVISGMSAGYSLGQRTAPAYLKERSVRLLPPLALGILLLSPYQVYAERATQGGFTGSFRDFLPHYFEGFYAFGGNFAWMGLHLWYVLMLFLFALLTFPLLRRVREPIALRHPAWLLLLALPPVLLEFFLDPDGAGVRDMGGWNPFTYLTMFLYGYLFFRHPSFTESLRRIGPWVLAGALATQTIMQMAVEATYGMTVAYALVALIRAGNSWLWILGLFYLGERFLQRETPGLRYWNKALMPFYILHQPVIVAAGMAVRGLAWGLPLKILVVVGGSFLVIMALFTWVVRPLKFLHPLFGMK